MREDMSWKVLSTEYVHRRPWLTARRDVVELPNGNINNEFYILESPDFVNVVAVTKEGKMLLVRQYRHAIRKTCFEIVAGVMEKGEEPLQAAKRELQEETGFGGGNWQLLMKICQNPGLIDNYTYCYLATDVEKISEQHLDATEDVEPYQFTKEEVREMLRKGEFLQALMVAPLYKFFTLNN